MLYLCEPSKNRACQRENCYAFGGTCMLTRDEEAARKLTNETLKEYFWAGVDEYVIRQNIRRLRKEERNEQG